MDWALPGRPQRVYDTERQPITQRMPPGSERRVESLLTYLTDVKQGQMNWLQVCYSTSWTPISYTLLQTQRIWQIPRLLTWPLLFSQPLTYVERYNIWMGLQERTGQNVEEIAQKVFGVRRRKEDLLIKDMEHAPTTAIQVPAPFSSAHQHHDKKRRPLQIGQCT